MSRLFIAMLVAALAGSALGATSVSAQPAVSAAVRSLLYQDDDSTTISTTSAEISGRPDERWQIGARYLIDVVSSASVDVVTQATGRFEDLRHEAGANVGLATSSESNVGVSYAYSTENDWQSNNVAMSGNVELLQRNLSLGLALGLQDNDISRAGTFGFRRDLDAYLATASATYTATPRDLVHVALSVSLYDGFQASPYRYLTIRTRGYAEEVPQDRFRSAVLLRHNRYLGGGFALRSHARGYADSYAVKALTAGTELAFEAQAYELAAWVRGHGQLAAEFYREVYASQQRFMTLDKELSTFVDAFVGARGALSLDAMGLQAWRVELHVAAFYFYFLDFAALESRFGGTATLGLTAEL